MDRWIWCMIVLPLIRGLVVRGSLIHLRARARFSVACARHFRCQSNRLIYRWIGKISVSLPYLICSPMRAIVRVNPDPRQHGIATSSRVGPHPHRLVVPSIVRSRPNGSDSSWEEVGAPRIAARDQLGLPSAEWQAPPHRRTVGAPSVRSP